MNDPKSAPCPQCSTRRLRLMKRSGHFPVLPNTWQHSDQVCNSRFTSMTETKLDTFLSYQPSNTSPYPQFKSFSTFLMEFKHRLTGFLHAQSVFFLFKQSKRINSVFALDGEFSVCCTDFDLLRRRSQIEEESLKLKRAIEHVGRLKFRFVHVFFALKDDIGSHASVSCSPTPQSFELDGGGVAIRFQCIYPVPILEAQAQNSSGDPAPAPTEVPSPSFATVTKHMKCELEIATLPDHSHRFIPGQRTIIRFRLLG